MKQDRLQRAAIPVQHVTSQPARAEPAAVLLDEPGQLRERAREMQLPVIRYVEDFSAEPRIGGIMIGPGHGRFHRRDRGT